MKRSILPTLFVLLLVLTGIAQANPVMTDPPLPPRPPITLPTPEPTPPVRLATTLNSNFPQLKAVLLVGPIDGDNGSWTNEAKEDMELAAGELEANGVSVARFYTPDNDWEQIKAAAQGAHFLFYRGHGVYWSPMPSPLVGGFRLKNKFVSPDEIRSDLHLAPNAIIMLYGCFTAGTASNDSGSISSQEAQRRVAEYSTPFFANSAGGYYANWFGNAFQMYVRGLFAGQTLGQAYESYSDFNIATVERYTHPNHLGTSMWLDQDFWDGQTKYNNAFVGKSDQTLVDLFEEQPVQHTVWLPLIRRS